MFKKIKPKRDRHIMNQHKKIFLIQAMAPGEM